MRNYKVFAALGTNYRLLLLRHLCVLDTGGEANFVLLIIRPSNYEPMLEPTVLPLVSDANNRPLRMLGQVSLVTSLGTSQVTLKFFLCQRLAAPAVLGCNFCDSHVESIHVQSRYVDLLDRTRVTIVRKPPKRDPEVVPLSLPQQYPKVSRRVLPKLRVVKRVVILAGSWLFVHVTTERSGLSVQEPL